MNYTNISQYPYHSYAHSSRLSKFWKELHQQSDALPRKPGASTSLTIWTLRRRKSFPRFRRAMMTLIAIAGIQVGQSQAKPLRSEGGQVFSQSWKIRKGPFIHFTGLIRDQDTQHPLDQVSLVLMGEDEFLAGTFADADGKFLLQVPTKDLAATSLTLKIQYLNHVFIRQDLDPCSQDLTVDLDRAVLLKTVEVEAESPFEASLSLKLGPHLDKGVA